MAFPFKQTQILFTQGCVLLSLVEICYRRRFLNVNVFSLFRNHRPLERGGALHLNKLESPTPKDDLCQIVLNWPSGSGEEDLTSLC